MDGLLIDSEPLWKEAEKEVFASVWVHLTHDMMRETTGLNVSEVVKYWQRHFPENIVPENRDILAHAITQKMRELITQKWVGMTGYKNILDFMKAQGLTIAINSSSDYSLIDAVIDRLKIREYVETVHSGQDEPYGKPHPGWYISTAKKLWIEPSECLVFEDSLNGIISAKSARMKCVAVPEKENFTNPKFAIADAILDSLEEFDDALLTRLGW